MRNVRKKKRAGGSTSGEILEVTLMAAKQVGRADFLCGCHHHSGFCAGICLGGAGRKNCFIRWRSRKPLAMVGSAILAVTLVPVLCAILVRGPFQAEHENWLMRGLLAVYDPVLAWALAHRKTVIGLAAVSLAAAWILALGVPGVLVAVHRKSASATGGKIATGHGQRIHAAAQ